VRVRQATTTPWASYSLLAITVVVFLAQITSESLVGRDFPALVGLKVNELIQQGQYWRLITPMFLHGSILHIGFNMYALYILGPGLERNYGHGRFLALYGLSGFAGNVASLMFSQAPSLGSSTAIFGLLGAQGVFMYQNQELLGAAARRALNNVIMIAVINLAIGLAPQIDNWGHIGGLLGGSAFAFLGGPLLRVEGIFPAVTVKDNREPGDVVRAGLFVALVFLILTASTLLMRGG
jgi:rhomboid protease GluP